MGLKDLSFLDLELFIALGELRSVRAVSRERNLNPSQVSKALKRIEKDAGTPLFTRTALGVSLTPEGVSFRQGARAILAQLSTLSAAGRSTEKHKTKTYTIGTTNLLNVHLLPKVLTQVSQEVPHVRFRILDVGPDQIANLGLKGLIDIALHFESLKWTQAWESHSVGELDYGLFGRRGHPLSARTTSQKVKEYPFILPIYLQQNSVRFGNDRCPLPSESRIAGDQTSTAITAVRLAQSSDQLMFIPKIVAEGSELIEIQVDGWKNVKQLVYISLNSQTIQKSVEMAFTQALRAACRLR